MVFKKYVQKKGKNQSEVQKARKQSKKITSAEIFFYFSFSSSSNLYPHRSEASSSSSHVDSPWGNSSLDLVSCID